MAARQTPWGTWDHLPLTEVIAIFDGFPHPWWIAGGYAIDAFAGPGRREHDDIDVSLFHSDQLALREHVRGWDVHAADPPGTLRTWAAGEVLPLHVHDIWARGHADDPWRFQVMLNPGGPDEFVCRRDERIRMPLREALWSKDGVRYLAPEIQLLFKAKGVRPKDEQDFADCLPMLSARQVEFLRGALLLTLPGHAWLRRL